MGVQAALQCIEKDDRKQGTDDLENVPQEGSSLMALVYSDAPIEETLKSSVPAVSGEVAWGRCTTLFSTKRSAGIVFDKMQLAVRPSQSFLTVTRVSSGGVLPGHTFSVRQRLLNDRTG